jgi:hypothetical protein
MSGACDNDKVGGDNGFLTLITRCSVDPMVSGRLVVRVCGLKGWELRRDRDCVCRPRLLPSGPLYLCNVSGKCEASGLDRENNVLELGQYVFSFVCIFALTSIFG